MTRGNGTPVPSPLPRLAYRIREVCSMTGLPKSTLYDAITRNELRVIRVGKGSRKVILIPAEELDRFLQSAQK